MTEFGHYTLFLAWTLSLYGVIAGVYAGKSDRLSWIISVRNATIANAVALFCSTACLGIAFLTNDYTNQYVWQYSNRDMLPIYKLTAIWGGMDGSMLLWCLILSINAAVLAIRGAPRKVFAWALMAINTSLLFFITVTTFFTNPFRFIRAPFIPPDGNGLNPLLQNPYMAIHPPMLYLGFTTLAVPYAICIAALLGATFTNEWIRLVRRWTLVGWGILTIGITLGGHWAYLELGWGGFWAWDPVENASFLPWLTATAFLHSVMVQERKDMLKMWNIWLIVLTYGLTVFGTFLTRSGVVQSIHAFASTDVGWVFLSYLAFILVTTVILTFSRRRELRPERRIESMLSREAAFLVNNLLFLSICFSILWGVMFPVLSEAVTGKKQMVGIPYFNSVNVPLFLLLIFLMGFGPLVAWRKTSFHVIRKTFLTPFLFACIIAGILIWAGVSSFYPVLSYSLCFFVVATIMGELHQAARAQRASSQSPSFGSGLTTVLQRHRIRYGGYLVHLGVVVVTIGITASMAHKIEREFTLAPGESYQIGRFTITLNNLHSEDTTNYEALVGSVLVTRTNDQTPLATLSPELRRYRRNDETTTEVALRMGPREDVYVVLAGLDDTGTRGALKVFINPLQIWLWIGVAIMTLGTIVVLVPQRKVPQRPHHRSLETTPA